MTASLPERVVLDSGAVERVETHRVVRGLLRRLLEAGADVELPSVVLAEIITGRPRDARVNRVIKRFGTTPTPEPTARRAGALRRAVKRRRKPLPSAVDAIVAAHALLGAPSAVVLTTDPEDLARLTERAQGVIVEPV